MNDTWDGFVAGVVKFQVVPLVGQLDARREDEALQGDVFNTATGAVAEEEASALDPSEPRRLDKHRCCR